MKNKNSKQIWEDLNNISSHDELKETISKMERQTILDVLQYHDKDGTYQDDDKGRGNYIIEKSEADKLLFSAITHIDFENL